VAPRTVRDVNLREQAVYRAGQDIAGNTGRPVSAAAIANATGFDDAALQQILRAMDAKGFLACALRGHDRIDTVAF
jgi:hypothetical protein